jgi:hypothetical protein
MRPELLARLTVALFIVAALAVACSDGDDGDGEPSERGDWTVDDAREFEDFAVLWAGQEFQGIELERVIRHRTPEGTLVPEDLMLFMYGTCDPGPQEGCAVPLSISNENCRVSQSPVPPAGAPFFRGGGVIADGGEDATVVWTADVRVKIYAGDAELRQAAAAALVALNGRGPAEPSEPLPILEPACAPPIAPTGRPTSAQ